jgi:hypothetical protein
MVERHCASTKQLRTDFLGRPVETGGDGGEYSSLQSEIYRHWVFEVCSKLISQEINFEMGWLCPCRFSVLEPSFCAAPKAGSVIEFADPKKPPEAVLTTMGAQR